MDTNMLLIYGFSSEVHGYIPVHGGVQWKWSGVECYRGIIVALQHCFCLLVSNVYSAFWWRRWRWGVGWWFGDGVCCADPFFSSWHPSLRQGRIASKEGGTEAKYIPEASTDVTKGTSALLDGKENENMCAPNSFVVCASKTQGQLNLGPYSAYWSFVLLNWFHPCFWPGSHTDPRPAPLIYSREAKWSCKSGISSTVLFLPTGTPQAGKRGSKGEDKKEKEDMLRAPHPPQAEPLLL